MMGTQLMDGLSSSVQLNVYNFDNYLYNNTHSDGVLKQP